MQEEATCSGTGRAIELPHGPPPPGTPQWCCGRCIRCGDPLDPTDDGGMDYFCTTRFCVAMADLPPVRNECAGCGELLGECQHVFCRELVFSDRVASYRPCETGEHIRGERGEYTFNWDHQSVSWSWVDDHEMRMREGFPTREEILRERYARVGLVWDGDA